MPIADRYIHSLVLRRGTPSAPDRTGHQEPEHAPENYQPFMGNWQDRSGIEVKGPELGGTIVADVVVFAARGLAPSEHDQIARGDRLADVVWVKDLHFGSINDHLEILCQEIRPGQPGGGS